MRILREIFRPSTAGEAKEAIMGVCAYIANRFKLDVLAVRVALVATAYFTGSFSKFIVAYIIFGVVLSISGEKQNKPKKKRRVKVKVGKVQVDIDEQSNDYHAERYDESVEVEVEKERPRLSRTAVKQMERSLKRLDSKIHNLETCVTSSHFKLSREFRDLGKKTENTASV